MNVILNGRKRSIRNPRPLVLKIEAYLEHLAFKQFLDYRELAKKVGSTHDSVCESMRDPSLSHNRTYHENKAWCGSKRSVKWLNEQLRH